MSKLWHSKYLLNKITVFGQKHTWVKMKKTIVFIGIFSLELYLWYFYVCSQLSGDVLQRMRESGSSPEKPASPKPESAKTEPGTDCFCSSTATFTFISYLTVLYWCFRAFQTFCSRDTWGAQETVSVFNSGNLCLSLFLKTFSAIKKWQTLLQKSVNHVLNLNVFH